MPTRLLDVEQLDGRPRVVRLLFPTFDIRADFGANGVEDQDATEAFEDAWDAAPEAAWEWDEIGLGRPSGSIVVNLPGINKYNEPAVYRITRELDIPAERKSVHFVTSTAGARIVMDEADGDYILTCPSSGDRALTFDGVIFQGCGIQFEGGSRLFFNLLNGQAVDSRDYFLRCLGDSVHNINIDKWLFSGCNGAIFQSTSCEKWWIEKFLLWRCAGDFGNMLFGSTRNTIRGFDCEAPPVGYDMGYFTFMNGPNDLRDGSFGTESDTGYEAPRAAIHIGLPATQAALPGAPTNPSWITGINIRDVDCEGSVGSGLPDADSGAHVMQLNVPLRESVFEPRKIGKHYSHLIKESFSASADQYAFDNEWMRQHKQMASTHLGGTFSRGGRGWNLEHNTDSPDSDVALAWGSATVGSNLTKVAQTTPADMYLVTLSVAGDYEIYWDATNLDTNSLTFEWQAMAGSLYTMRAYIADIESGVVVVTSPYKIWRLDHNASRKTYRITCPWTPGHDARFVFRIGNGAETGTVYIANPKRKHSLATITP